MASAEAILEEFASNEYPPALDKAGQLLVAQYLENQGMKMGFGVLPVGAGEEVSPTEVLLHHDLEARTMLERQPGAVIAPYILSGEYKAGGIGIWFSGSD